MFQSVTNFITSLAGNPAAIQANGQEEQFRTKFQNNMDAAEAIYLKLSTATPQEKADMAIALGEAWESLKALRELPQSNRDLLKTQAPELARITLLRGECRWATEDMEITRQLFCLSLQLARGHADVISRIPGIDTDSLEDLPKRLATDQTVFSTLEDEFASAPLTDAIIREALESEDPHTALAIANGARSIGGTYQNHNRYQLSPSDDAAAKERKICLCENAMKIAETVWEKVNTPEAQWLLLTSKYNTGPYRHGLRNPNDNTGRRKIYEEVLGRLEELEKDGNTSIKLYQQRAQCYNMISRLLPEPCTPTDKYKLIEQAAKVALEHANNGFDVFLSRMFPQNRASFAFMCLQVGAPIEGVTIEMIDGWHDTVQEMCAQQGYNHFYDAIFCLNAAKVALYRGDLTKSTAHIQKALEVCDKHGSSTADIRQMINAFCTEKKIEL